MQFLKIRRDQFEVILGVGSHRMTRNLRDLPGTELGENALGQRLAFTTQPSHLFVNVDFGIIANKAQLLDFSFEFCNRLFKIKEF
jgi:hypothetical protein